jgi:hypothetical protein
LMQQGGGGVLLVEVFDGGLGMFKG